MKKAQVSVVYLGLLTLMSIFILTAVFIWSNSLKDEAAIEFNEHHAEALLTGLEQKLLKLKNVAEPPSGIKANTTNITVSVPQKIGDEEYFIRGKNQDLVLQISGKGFSQGRKTIFRKRMYWWDSANFSGGSFSGNGEIIFNYNGSSGNVILS